LVGQSLKTELLALYEDTLNRNRRDKRLSEISREFLKISDGHVKEAALFLLSTQEPTPENLNAILESIMNYHDANLIALALMELEKYQGAQYQVQLYENFKSNLKTGSIFVKEALARGIDQFVTLDTRGDFEDLLNEMPLNSRVRQNLKSSLDRFDHSPIR
jgi:phenylalanyl-tRNA synthetase beta subunit